MFKNPLANMVTEQVGGAVAERLFDEMMAPKMKDGKLQVGIRVNAFGIQTKQAVRIPDAHRMHHMWVVGRTGSGKSTVLLNMIVQDMLNGQGLCVIDPKGDLVDEVLKYVPAERFNDVVLVNATDTEHVIGFNMFERTDGDLSHIIYEHFMAIFQKLLDDSLGVTVKQLLANTVLTLLEVDGATIADIKELLFNDEYREQVLLQVDDPEVLDFWRREYNPLSDAQKRQRANTITNKLTDWVATKTARYVVYQSESTIDLRQVMDGRKILLVKIPQGIMGEGSSAFMGALMVSKLQVTVMQRAGLPENQKPPFILYVDEFQNFVTSSFQKILSEARSYGLGLVVANQYEKQLDTDLAEALKKNVAGCIECVRSIDSHSFRANYILYQDGDDHVQIRMSTLPPPSRKADPAFIKKIRDASRFKYTVPVADIEADIARTRKRRGTDRYYEVEPEMSFGEPI